MQSDTNIPSEKCTASSENSSTTMPTYIGKGALDENGNRIYVDIELPR